MGGQETRENPKNDEGLLMEEKSQAGAAPNDLSWDNLSHRINNDSIGYDPSHRRNTPSLYRLIYIN